MLKSTRRRREEEEQLRREMEEKIRQYEREIELLHTYQRQQEDDYQRQRTALEKEREDLKKEREDLRRKVAKVSKMETYRAEVSGMTDRDILIDTYNQLTNIFDDMSSLKITAEDTKVDLKTELDFAIRDMKKELTNAISDMKSELQKAIDQMNRLISTNLLYTDDIEHSVENALDRFSWDSCFEFESAVSSAVDSKLDDLERKIDSIESGGDFSGYEFEHAIESALDSAIDSKIDEIKSKLDDLEYKIDDLRPY